MALDITSPGVQITEKDLSLRTTVPAGTQVLVPGFAVQGPISEPTVITTVSELESIYGVPTTPAERYFYYSCREILNSPAVLTTIRLPYGADGGSAYSSSYSALLYPVLSAGSGGTVNEFQIGAPTQVSLTPTQYNAILEGNFDWSGDALVDSSAELLTSGGITLAAGLVVLNDLQTTINELGEGYYIGFSDNKSVSSSSPDFDSVTAICSLSTNNTTKYLELNTDRLDFALSATSEDSNRGVGSISETLEKVGFIDFETTLYQDHLSLGVFKIRRSTADSSLLTIGTTEKYIGSLDYNRRKSSQTGGTLETSYIEDIINEGSPSIKILVNPAISKNHDWTVGDTLVPTTRITMLSAAKKLFPVGVYTPESRDQNTTKIVGSVPTKLDKALRTVESPENTVVDVVIDAGLSTIFSFTEFSSNQSFDDEKYIGSVSSITNNWLAVVKKLVDFAESTRRDCVAIIDPPRNIFVNGKDSKVIDTDGKTFTADVYNPLRALASALETNYGAMYGNWIKVTDSITKKRFWLPFSSYAGAVFARNDSIANPWSAPAGLVRGTFKALDLALNPNQKQRDRLYEISVNPVVFFTGDGFTIMGQKTLQTRPTAFDRLNVRRLFLSLERAVQRTLKYFVFEPNTEFTRTRLRSSITPIFEFAKNTEGLYDYLIVADERNNTPEIIDNNQLIVDIYIKPVRTAEFILVNFIATRTGQDFQELI